MNSKDYSGSATSFFRLTWAAFSFVFAIFLCDPGGENSTPKCDLSLLLRQREVSYNRKGNDSQLEFSGTNKVWRVLILFSHNWY